ncbi:bifunctional hydroxymethylpyrimidine kinase/phosphomethylpyrimidine kinase [Candidatus Poribacteria bacterium]|nr:bifunctional hydroxymethylpyrimidine kinase/phosphomethylpyrimidine kinase [Candidatus Poribacteria bacterium]
MKNILTIAGFDPSGGAGLQADIKTFSALETYGLSVATSLTVQNTHGVFDVIEIAPDVISNSLQTIASDVELHAIKIGMLCTETVIEVVASFLEKIFCSIVVLDPVLISKNGYWLLKESSLPFFIKRLLPKITLITPNIKELQLLSNIEITNDNDIKKAANIIKNFGPKHVLIKGSRVTPELVTDLLYDGINYTEFTSKNLEVHHFLHGTGCTFASAITSELAKGYTLTEAIKTAQIFLNILSLSPLVVGKGNYNLNHLGILQRDAEKYSIIYELKQAFKKLEEACIGSLIPEIQSNMVYAMEGAALPFEVAGFPGRIIRLDNSIACVSAPEFGKTKHMASVVLAVMHYFPSLRSAMNIKYSSELIGAAKKLGYKIYSFDRKNEPEDNKNIEGKTLDWGIKETISKTHEPPDLIYDTGGFGKEAIIRVIGHNPQEIVNKILAIKKKL